MKIKGMNRLYEVVASTLFLFSHSIVPGSVTPWTVAHQAPLSMGFPQARILEWVAISYSGESSWPRDWTHIKTVWSGCIFFTWMYYEDGYCVWLGKASPTSIVKQKAWKSTLPPILIGNIKWEPVRVSEPTQVVSLQFQSPMCSVDWSL